jgi:hypothetical protein
MGLMAQILTLIGVNTMKTFYLSSMPDFRELAEMCSSIDSTRCLNNDHIVIVNMDTGKILAMRLDHKLWEFCYYTIEKGDRYYALEKKYKRGFITYGQFLELIKG